MILEKYRSWVARHEPPVIVELAFVFLLGALFLKIWWGHPFTVHHAKVDAGGFFLRNAYYVLIYILLFSYSRTVSLKVLFRWFYLGLIVLPLITFFIQKWVLAWDIKDVSYFGYWPGYWRNKGSVHHACVTGPIIEEVLKAVPLVLFLLIARVKKSLHSFTISDWTLIGFVIGIGFGIAESLVWLQERSINFRLDFSWPRGWTNLIVPHSVGIRHYEVLGKSYSYLTGMHGLWTGYLGLGIGLAVHLSRKGAKWKSWVWLIPALVFLWAVVDHGLGNLTLRQGSDFLKAPFIRFLCAVTLGGYLPTYGFGLALVLVALYEFRRVQRRISWDHLLSLWVHLRVLALIVGTLTWTSWGDYFRSLAREFRFSKLLGFPLFVVVFAIVSANSILDYVVTQWRFARVRHAVAWSSGE